MSSEPFLIRTVPTLLKCRSGAVIITHRKEIARIVRGDDDFFFVYQYALRTSLRPVRLLFFPRILSDNTGLILGIIKIPTEVKG